MEKKLRLFVTILGLLLSMSLITLGADVGEARTKKSSVKRAVQKSAQKKSKQRAIAKAAAAKKLTAEKRRKHAELVAKLKEEERLAKEKAPSGSLEANILGKSATGDRASETPERSSASTPMTVTGGPDLVEDLPLDFGAGQSPNDLLPAGSEDQLDSGDEF